MSDENKNKNKNLEEELLNKELDDELEVKETTKEAIEEAGDIKEASDENISDEVAENVSENNEEEIDKGEEDKEAEDKFFYVKLRLLKIQSEVQQVLKYLEKEGVEENFTIEPAVKEKLEFQQEKDEEGLKIIEGVFDGKEMIGADNKRYSVPSNYASKSKLVEGDIMKLIIKQDGTFIYKQVNPVERDRLIGLLIKNETNNQYYAMVDSQRWQLLTASVTFFKGGAGDEVVILIPKGAKSKWAAVENIVKKN